MAFWEPIRNRHSRLQKCQTAQIPLRESKRYNTLNGGAIMREGRYESEPGSRVGTAITFLLIGLGAGAVVGMLFAPKAGRQMRRDLRRGYDNARETLDDWKESARDFAEEAMERGSDFAEDLRERVKPLARGIRRG
jgi:gas vesicle protein